MLWVRFQNGVTVQYNNATNVMRHEGGGISLIDDKGCWYAQVPPGSGAIVESVRPCQVFNSIGDEDGNKLARVLNDVSKIRQKISKLSTAERKARKKA